jgi:hypothetical protein
MNITKGKEASLGFEPGSTGLISMSKINRIKVTIPIKARNIPIRTL